MYGFVYIWMDKKHKRFYVGCHWGREDDGYICSSTWMKNAYKRRPLDFKRRILSIVTTNKKDLLGEEHKWLMLIKEEELGKRYYNLKISSTDGWWVDDNKSLSVKQKISKTKIAYWNSPDSDEARKKISDYNIENGIKPPSREGKPGWNKGLTKETDSRVLASSEKHSKTKITYWNSPDSDESRKKLSDNNTGKHHTEETKRKISESNKGRIVSEDTREKIGKANKGKLKGVPRAEESKRKTSETMKGRTFSEEHRKNLSNAWELRKTKNSLEKELLCGK